MTDFEAVWQELRAKIDWMIGALGDRSPHYSAGTYDDMRLDWWTSGFWPGILWILYDQTGEERYRNQAWDWDRRIADCFIRENNFHHDVGFQFLSTAVIKYKLTEDAEARRRALLAATFLAGRFNPVGRFLRAWNQEERAGWSIIDTMMNLSLLFWAADEFHDPRFRQIALAHADTALRHFIREDGTVNHIVRFDPETGAALEAIGGQGYGPDSAWSRGQAWAIYGMANVFRYSGDLKYLRAGQRVAHYFLAALPEDKVPYWDFRLPSFQGEPRDSSAAACAASGLLEIAGCLPEAEGRLYRESAEAILESLAANYAMFHLPEYQGVLRGATGNKNTNMAVDVSLIYGDYFFVEAVAKRRGWKHRIF